MSQLKSDIDELVNGIVNADPYKVVLSGGKSDYKKIVFIKKILKGKRCFQIEKYTEKQVFHENIAEDDLAGAVCLYLGSGYRQINVFATEEEWDVKISKKGKYTINRRNTTAKTITLSGNNRKKKYILE